MKVFLLSLWCVLGLVSGSVFASDSFYGRTPLETLNHVVENADTPIIESKFDGIINKGTFGNDRKISGTLDSIRDNISFYLNWVLFLGLTGATVLIVYNGFLLVFTPITGDQLSKVTKRLTNILIGVLVMTGFYFIIKIVLSIMNMILE